LKFISQKFRRKNKKIRKRKTR